MTYQESKMSVEWLETKIQNEIATYGTISPKMISIFAEQAKAMHKQEIIWAHGVKMKGVNNHKCVSGEQYYNETFGSNNK